MIMHVYGYFIIFDATSRAVKSEELVYKYKCDEAMHTKHGLASKILNNHM